MFLDTVPKGSEPRYVNEVEEKNGIEIVKSKITQEKKIIRFIASEAQIRVLEKIPMLSNVRIITDFEPETKMYNIEFNTTQWFSGGAFAKCEMGYIINTFVDKQTI